MKKLLALALVLTLVFSACASIAVADDLTENRPTLKFLVSNRTYDPNEDVPCKNMMELSGYTVVYEMLPSSNGDEKLMLILAGGEDYDIVELSANMFGRLSTMNVLTDLDDAIAKYGNYLNDATPETVWNTAKDAEGNVIALPRQMGSDRTQAYGHRSTSVFMTKIEILDELGLTVPTDLNSFTQFLETIHDAKNVAPLTTSSLWMKDLMSAFGLPALEWIEDNDGFHSILDIPAFRDYLAYCADLYQRGLLDADLPINNAESVNQKFTTDGAYVSPYAFYDIPSLVSGLTTSGYSTDLVCFEKPLVGEDGKYVLQTDFGINKYYGVPAASGNADHVVNYFNILSEPETFKISHIGYEGIHYTVDENGNYLPIFPAFTELNWGNQFSSLQDPAVEYKQWQCRARKTPEMAVAWEAINSSLKEEEAVFYLNRKTMTNSLEPVKEYSATLTTLLNDFMMQVVVDGATDDETFEAFHSRYMSEGGAEMLEAMNEWIKEYPLADVKILY